MYTLITAGKDFIRHCKFEKNLSPKTIKAYEIDLKQTVAFLKKGKYSLAANTITKEPIRDYIESISHLKPKSIKRKIATLKALFNYLEFEDKITVSPFRKMRIRIKEPKQLPKVMELAEVEKIFKSAYNGNQTTSEITSRITLKDIAVVELLFATGARVSEISNLKEQFIDLASGIIVLYGKGSKERIIQVCNKESLKILQAYYRQFKKEIASSGGYFLINRLGKKLSDQSIRNIVKRLTNKAKVQKHITPHVFRHTFATLLLEKNVDIKYIQTLLGHSSIMTTQIYTHVTKAKQREILRTKHPRREFSMVTALAG